jgi:hypothetical protein
MSANALLALVRARPFVPFEMEITGGKTYDVMHPEMALVTQTTVAVGAQQRQYGIPAGLHIVTTGHVVRVRPMPELAERQPGH